jgi:hypothetical protein
MDLNGRKSGSQMASGRLWQKHSTPVDQKYANRKLGKTNDEILKCSTAVALISQSNKSLNPKIAKPTARRGGRGNNLRLPLLR